METGDEIDMDMDMDIISVIEKYIELSVRRDNLKNTIENSKRDYAYAKIEGDMAFYDGDYQLEKGYNNSASTHIETQEKSEKELSQVEQLLEFARQIYTKTVQSLDELQLKEAAMTMSVKKTDVERKLEELTQRRIWANSKGDIAFSNHNFQEEQEYNRISSDCYEKIERVKPTLHYYETFINDLNYHADKKVSNDFGTSGPGR